MYFVSYGIKVVKIVYYWSKIMVKSMGLMYDITEDKCKCQYKNVQK